MIELSISVRFSSPHHPIWHLKIVLLPEMLIENVKIVFLQVIQELFSLNSHQKRPMRVFGQLVPVLPAYLQVLLGIGRYSTIMMMKKFLL